MMKRLILAAGTAATLTLGGLGAAAAESESEGETIYNSGTAPSCGTCHNRGVAGAPQIDKPEDWAERSSDVEELVQSTLSGKGAMPAYEGRADRDELILAIEYMLSTLD
ncbi:MAG: c-type cytochrome [Halorhodospira sp.]